MKQTIFFLIATISTVLFAEPVRSMLGADGISMVQTDEHDLPDGIVAVEFLESTGTQYIDTGIPFSDSTKIECELLVKNINSAFGVHEPVQLTRFTSAKNFQRKTVSYNYPTTLKDGIWHTLSFSDKVYVDGALCHTYNPIKWTGQAPMYLFALRSFNGTAGDMFIGAFRWFKIFDNGITVRDMIPICFTNEQGQTEGAMYDFVSGELFLNQGTGDFIIGPDL